MAEAAKISNDELETRNELIDRLLALKENDDGCCGGCKN